MFGWSSRTRKGFILPATILLCLLAATGTLWMIHTLADHQRIDRRGRDLSRAYFAAEAGLAQILHWGNFPDEYDNGGENGLFYRDQTTGEFPNLAAALAAGEVEIDSDKLEQFDSKYGYEVSSIESLTLVPASVSDPVSCLFKIRSVGLTPSARTRTILAYLRDNPIGSSYIALPAGLISLGTAGQDGNGVVHWGESWSKQSFDVANKSQLDHLDSTNSSYDHWAKYRTEGQLIFNSTWKSGSGKDIYQEDTRPLPATAPASGKYANGFEQFIPSGVLDWPDFLSLYDSFKAQAHAHGRYYSTDASGNVYLDGVEDSAHLVDFNDEFGEADRVNSPYDLVFIDTIDGNPPASDGSNLATVQNSGTGIGMKGVFWIGANLTQTGSGNPAALVAEMPDGDTDDTNNPSESLPKVYLDGVLYTAGWMDLAGNPVVYGSVVAEKGYASGGTPEIYYNYRLKDGLEIPKGNVGSVFTITLQDNY